MRAARSTQQRPRAARRHAEPLLGVGVDAAEAEIAVQAPRHDIGEQRRHAREAPGFHLHGAPQAPIELEGIRGFEVALERGDLGIETKRRHWRVLPREVRTRPVGFLRFAAP
ncbi:MAG: hypothetical protein E6J87_11165 [Deltaproteobacteria bacterium]|nr:MAG: hypothetical protein E6J87_11165 [Deltaproteobacteria bacterium]